jgi:hypothetical protein
MRARDFVYNTSVIRLLKQLIKGHIRGFSILSRISFTLLFIVLLFLPACSRKVPVDSNGDWQQNDLRILEAPNTSDPADDLNAAYARLTAADLELRFDLLGSPDPFGYDLYIVVGSQPIESQGQPFNSFFPLDQQPQITWSLALGFPSRGLPRAFDPQGEPARVRPRILRLAVQDSAVVRLQLKEISSLGDPQKLTFQAFLTRPGDARVIDSIGPVKVDGAAPQVHAPLLIVFSNTLPAATPAQALRRWDGAHTGPYGQRHGLGVLLQSAAQARIPVVLLDLKKPETLAALDALGGLPLVQELAQKHLLMIPDLVYGDPRTFANSLAFSQQAGQHFLIPKSPFLFGPAAALLSKNYTAAFARLNDTTHIIQADSPDSIRLIPLPPQPNTTDAQVDQEGVNLAIRKELLLTALGDDPGRLVVLGGDLLTSPWGDSLVADPVFRYIAGHPWINPLNGEDLLRLPAVSGKPDCADLLCIPSSQTINPNQDLVRQSLEESPNNLFTRLAWDSYFRLTEVTTNEQLRAIRSPYLAQVGLLLSAARWSANPTAGSTCATDLNWDGAPECILSSDRLFLIIDPQGSRLVLAAARLSGRDFQLIGARSQMTTGLGDPLDWHPERGLMGDPQEIPGAFAGPVEEWQTARAETLPGIIRLTNPVSGQRKTFKITDGYLLVEVEGSAHENTQIPLLLFDQNAYEKDWYQRYQTPVAGSPTQVSWKLANSIQVNVSARNATLSPNYFSDSLLRLRVPEDPNYSYPPGFFIPFSMGIIDIQPAGNYSVEISFIQP